MRLTLGALPLLLLAIVLIAQNPAPRLLQLPPGLTILSAEIRVPAGTEVAGDPAGSLLRLAPGFRGRAAIVVAGSGVSLRDFTIDGNRDALEVRAPLPPADVPFARYTACNGVFAAGVAHLSIERVSFRNIAGFAVLASRAGDVTIQQVQVADSGSRNPAGRNNATGGILLEEGTADFRVVLNRFDSIRGNAVWTHSLYRSPRNTRGLIALNRFQRIARDAIQIGHAIHVRVDQNEGEDIGIPPADVDIENLAVPVAIDTAGNVEQCTYIENRFRAIAGKCIDLDGFHDGVVRGNSCSDIGNYAIVMNNSNPGMQSRNIAIEGNRIDGAQFGAVFVIGSGHRIVRNDFRGLNRAHCNQQPFCYYAPDEPDMLRSGIYLGRGAARPAPSRGNLIEQNRIDGFGMAARCVSIAPGISAADNVVRQNLCGAP